MGTPALSQLVLAHARSVGDALYQGADKYTSAIDYARKFDALITGTDYGKVLWDLACREKADSSLPT